MSLHVLEFQRYCLTREDAHKSIDQLYDKFPDGMAFLAIAVSDHRGNYDGDLICLDSFPVSIDMIPALVQKILENAVNEYYMEDVSDN
jgi:hypothetical protein